MSERGSRGEPEGPWSNEFMHAREAVVAGIQSEIQMVSRGGVLRLKRILCVAYCKQRALLSS